MEKLKYVSIVVQLPDNRILLSKTRFTQESSDMWQITFGRIAPMKHNSPLITANELMWDKLGIKHDEYSEEYVDAKQLPAINENGLTSIHLFLLKFKTTLVFQAEPRKQFKAVSWKFLIEDVLTKKSREYQDEASIIVKQLLERGVIKQ